MVENVALKAAGLKQIKEALTRAVLAFVGGDDQGAERKAKAAQALVRAEQDISAAIVAEEARLGTDDHEALAAELRRRLACYAQADLADAPPEVLERIAAEGASQ